MSDILDEVTALLFSPRWLPRWGWHDNHRSDDGTPQYLPAIQQVQGEFARLVEAIGTARRLGSALQLGIGECDASHEVWDLVFHRATVTLDYRICRAGPADYPGLDVGSPEAREFAERHGPYDFLFIDAGHDFDSVKRDHETYRPMVRPGGIIAFHDALPRDTYPEIEVWKYLQTLPGVTTAGNDVGTAWIVKA